LLTSALPEGRTFRAPGFPFAVDGGPSDTGPFDLPEVGADTDAILSVLGLAETEIRAASGASKAKVA
jgi:crotonobetainyl-CoA:carnitine CoA-transferase CaiB-like acyl-CoA transferase